MTNVRVIATDLEFPEGPVVMPDGSVGKPYCRLYAAWSGAGICRCIELS